MPSRPKVTTKHKFIVKFMLKFNEKFSPCSDTNIVSEKRPVEIMACFLCAYTVMCAYDWIHVFVHMYTYMHF